LLNKLRALLNIKIGSKSVFVKIKRKKERGFFRKAILHRCLVESSFWYPNYLLHRRSFWS